MNNKFNNTFTDSGVNDPLPPIYKGKKVKIYPGILAKRTGNIKKVVPAVNTYPVTGKRRFGLRRYIFIFENGKFSYLGTRKGQRNGGFTATPDQTLIVFKLTAPGNISEDRQFKYFGKINSQDVYRESANSRIRYDNATTRWVWETRPATTPPAPPSGPFYTNAYSQVTTNTLKNSSAKNLIRWTYVSDPYNTATPELPATVNIKVKQWFNNNSLENLNSWPILNADMNYGKYPDTTYKWITYDENNNVVPENRPECLSDDLLNRCFQGVNLKPYDIVFVEVMWTWFENRKTHSKYWGYSTNIHNFEWWSPAPFNTKTQKGRIYRIGILEKNNKLGETDKVLFAQRTRLVTTKYPRGGNTALE